MGANGRGRNVAVVVAVVVAGVIFVGHGHGHGDDHDYDHHRSLRPGAQVRRGMAPLLAAIRAFAALAVGPRINDVRRATPASSHGGAVIPWHNAWVMSLVRRLGIAPLLLAIAGLLGGGCARPYAGQKTLAALGTGLLAVGGTTWVIGERGNRDGVAVAGMATTALGAVALLAAGGWLAIGVACTEDPDCPRTEECREIPSPPGGVPYRQCMPRQGP